MAVSPRTPETDPPAEPIFYTGPEWGARTPPLREDNGSPRAKCARIDQNQPQSMSIAEFCRGHAREFKLPSIPFEKPVEVAAIRCDRKTGEVTYHRECQLAPIGMPNLGVDLSIARNGNESCASTPVGMTHVQGALLKTGADADLDCMCDCGALQRLFATPYEPDRDWQLVVHFGESCSWADLVPT